MNTNPLSKKENPGISDLSPENAQVSIYAGLNEINIADGGEFLDDGIRMNDQPLGEKIVKE